MKRLLAAAAVFTALAGHAMAAPVEVEVANVQSSTGKVYLAIFDQAGWDAYEPVAAKVIPVSPDGVSASFEGLAPGQYAIRIFQDVNANGELDLGQYRIPVEPYGFSNDAPVMMGPLSWKNAVFEVTGEGARQRITLR
jgi:uncharacterized protein (DUF2141 family)